MKTIRLGQPLPAGTMEAFNLPGGDVLCIETDGDYESLPAEQKAIHAASQAPNHDALLIVAFEAEQQAAKAAEFEAFKARSGEPVYKAAAVKIAAEKLALTPLIDAALDVLINADGDKALLVWWTETDAISRGDAQWQRIEAAVEWPKDVTAADLFDLAATI